MKHILSRMALPLIFTVLWLGTWTGPALALYAPCQGVNAWLVGTTVHYQVTDPVSGQVREETWALSIGDEALVESLTVEGGIVAWIAKYRWTGDADYVYAVHYRIFDPGRGVWKGDFWGWFGSGANRAVTSLIVKDGVVAWKSKYQISTNPTDLIEHAVRYATYNPGNGSWALGEDIYPRVAYNSPVAPENLRVKNGVVAWPMNPASGESTVDVYHFLYDPELNRWVGGGISTHAEYRGFDWIEIIDDTVQIQVMFSHWFYGSADMWIYYDAFNHRWLSTGGSQTRPEPVRKPSFAAQPASGFVPFWVCFWDTSIALGAGSWSWSYGDGGTGLDRSPLHRYNAPGTRSVQQTVEHGGTNYFANGVVEAQLYTPTGGLQINGGAAYTSSLNVTLNLNNSPGATQMRFYEWPGLWIDWENVAPGRAYQCYGGIGDGLRTVYVQFRDALGTESPWYQDEITVDTTPPAPMLILNYGQDTTRNRHIRVEWNAIDANGVAKMRYTAFNEEDLYLIWTSWMDYQATVMTIPFSARPGKKTVIVEFMDAAGNITSVQDSARLIRPFLPFIPLLLLD
jgi:PKD repeat protein